MLSTSLIVTLLSVVHFNRDLCLSHLAFALSDARQVCVIESLSFFGENIIFLSFSVLVLLAAIVIVAVIVVVVFLFRWANF